MKNPCSLKIEYHVKSIFISNQGNPLLDDFHENAHITYSTCRTGIVTSTNSRRRFMNSTSFHSSPGMIIMGLGGVSTFIGYFLFVQRLYGFKGCEGKMIRQQIYSKIGYTGLGHANNSFRYELDRILEA